MAFLDSYIVNDYGVLRDAYIAKAKQIGITVNQETDWYDRKYLYVLKSGELTTGGMCDSTLSRKHQFICKE